MSFYLVVQKDTFENGKVKSIIRESQQSPQNFLNSLQELSCYEFQLVAYTKFNQELEERVLKFSSGYKTNYGKDWYDFDGDGLSGVISLFLEYDYVSLNLHCVSNVIEYSLTLFPIVSKEVNIVPISVSSASTFSASTLSDSYPKHLVNQEKGSETKEEERKEERKENKEEVIISLIEKLEPTKSDLRRDRPKTKNNKKR